MSKLEMPMILQYWASRGGTLVTEFQAVPRTAGVGRRLLDAVILPALPNRRVHWREVELEGQDVIVLQAKAHRLGMYLMGQAVFSAELLRQRFKPRSVKSVILCSADDAVLRPLLESYLGVEVVVLPGTPNSAVRGGDGIGRCAGVRPTRRPRPTNCILDHIGCPFEHAVRRRCSCFLSG